MIQVRKKVVMILIVSVTKDPILVTFLLSELDCYRVHEYTESPIITTSSLFSRYLFKKKQMQQSPLRLPTSFRSVCVICERTQFFTMSTDKPLAIFTYRILIVVFGNVHL
jgi:hypothetical protein